MKIKSSELSAIDEYLKFFINQGVYFLYSIDHQTAVYLLEAENDFFLLDNIGNIIQKSNEAEKKNIIESVYFSDIEFPPTAKDIKIA